MRFPTEGYASVYAVRVQKDIRGPCQRFVHCVGKAYMEAMAEMEERLKNEHATAGTRAPHAEILCIRPEGSRGLQAFRTRLANT